MQRSVETKTRTGRAIARRGNETDETEVLIWVGSLPVNVKVQAGIRKTMAKPFVAMKE
jgi:hypothetical protein